MNQPDETPQNTGGLAVKAQSLKNRLKSDLLGRAAPQKAKGLISKAKKVKTIYTIVAGSPVILTAIPLLALFACAVFLLFVAQSANSSAGIDKINLAFKCRDIGQELSVECMNELMNSAGSTIQSGNESSGSLTEPKQYPL